MYPAKAVDNGGPKHKPNSVLVSVTLKNDAIGSEKPNANALRLGDSVSVTKTKTLFGCRFGRLLATALPVASKKILCMIVTIFLCTRTHTGMLVTHRLE